MHSRLLATLVALFCSIGFTIAADIIRIDQPTNNQQVPSNTDTAFQYTILGAQVSKYFFLLWKRYILYIS